MLHIWRGRASALVVGAALLAALRAACSGSPDDPGAPATTASTGASPTATTATGRTIEVAFAGGQVQGGRRTERVELGEQVRIRAISDVAEELHVHTYDRLLTLQPSQPAELVFTADIPGRHEVEFEKSRRQALVLEVG